jgi:hypothetical protein
MSDRLTLAVALSVLLVGCATTREQPSLTSPYTLSNSEIETVVNGIRSTQNDLDRPGFTGFRAAQRPDGQVEVCGWMTPNRNSTPQPFIGTLSAGKFALKGIGGQPPPFDDPNIVSECREHDAGLY